MYSRAFEQNIALTDVCLSYDCRAKTCVNDQCNSTRQTDTNHFNQERDTLNQHCCLRREKEEARNNIQGETRKRKAMEANKKRQGWLAHNAKTAQVAHCIDSGNDAKPNDMNT